ncbi:MAG: hypothetical protein NZ699_09435 [Roseiflexus sp.]|nr:hypothetical protein [Roseiflexus sp.]
MWVFLSTTTPAKQPTAAHSRAATATQMAAKLLRAAAAESLRAAATLAHTMRLASH